MTIIISICNCQKNLSRYISLDTAEDEIREKRRTIQDNKWCR